MSTTAARRLARVSAAVPCVWLAAGLAGQVPTLEDPQRGVFDSFPAADAYQVIVRNVDTAARKSIEQRLPFRVHYDELGAHSLYVALRGRRPIGLLLVQYEESAFGLASIEWAITLDERVAGFRFQRARSRVREDFEASEFVRLLRGRTCAELEALLDDDGVLRPDTRGVAPGTEELAAAVVRSAVKAFAVLEIVWPADLARLADLGIGLQFFPQAHALRRVWPPMVPAAPAVPAPRDRGAAAEPGPRWVVCAYGYQGKPLGAVAKLVVDPRELDSTVLVVIDADGVIVTAEPTLPTSPRLREQCASLRGGRLNGVVVDDGDALSVALRRLRETIVADARPGR